MRWQGDLVLGYTNMFPESKRSAHGVLAKPFSVPVRLLDVVCMETHSCRAGVRTHSAYMLQNALWPAVSLGCLLRNRTQQVIGQPDAARSRSF